MPKKEKYHYTEDYDANFNIVQEGIADIEKRLSVITEKIFMGNGKYIKMYG